MEVIKYFFKSDAGASLEFEVQLDRVELSQDKLQSYPEWTKLDFNKCPNCPLESAAHTHCPTAVDLEPVIRVFKSHKSYELMTIEVYTPDRIYIKKCDLQTGIRSLTGLIMATSHCPILSQLKCQAKFHLPFASIEETLFRTTGAYLIKQYFLHKSAGSADWDLNGLSKFYKDLELVNRAFFQRVLASSENDANLNAVGTLASLSMAVTFSLEEKLDEIRSLFCP